MYKKNIKNSHAHPPLIDFLGSGDDVLTFAFITKKAFMNNIFHINFLIFLQILNFDLFTFIIKFLIYLLFRI